MELAAAWSLWAAELGVRAGLARRGKRQRAGGRLTILAPESSRVPSLRDFGEGRSAGALSCSSPMRERRGGGRGSRGGGAAPRGAPDAPSDSAPGFRAERKALLAGR